MYNNSIGSIINCINKKTKGEAMRISGLISFIMFFSLHAQAALHTQEVTYEANGTELKGYLAYDNASKEKRPAVLVVHEWWGHNDYARERARRLAQLGYIALAVDMYGEGKQAAHPDDAQKFSSEIANNMELGIQRFKAAMDLIQKHRLAKADDIAAIGYCFGGAVVLQMAREGLPLDAVASFHGSLASKRPAQADAVQAKILVAHGGADPFVPAEHITGFIDEMNKAGADYQFNIYGGALHSFTNPAADEFGKRFELPLKYHKQADEDSWRAMKTFLREAFSD